MEGAPPPALAALAGQVAEWRDRFGAALRGVAPGPLGSGFGDVIRAACEDQPILLAVDDAQWADAETLAVLETLLRDLANQPLGILLAAAPQPPHPPLAALRARS